MTNRGRRLLRLLKSTLRRSRLRRTSRQTLQSPDLLRGQLAPLARLQPPFGDRPEPGPRELGDRMPDAEAIERLRTGIPLDGHRTLPARASVVNKRATGPAKAGHYDRKTSTAATRDGERNAIVLLTIREGRNRQVRRMLEAVGHPVRKLRRTKIGPISDREIRPGEWRELTTKEVQALQRAAEVDAPRPKGAAAAARPGRTATRRRSSPRGRGDNS